MGELSGIEPPRMNWQAVDLPTEFRSFRQYCELIFRGPFAAKGQGERVTYILLWVGQEGLRMYNTWELTEADKQDVDVIWDKFQSLIEPKSNYRLSRFHLQKFRQTNTETVDEYMTRCRTQARKCRFRDAVETDERLTEQLIVGVRHGKVQEKLLCRDETLTLDAAMDIARTHEATLANMQQFAGDANSISHVSRSRKTRDSSGRRQVQHSCGKCGRRHAPTERCPAEGSTCNACGKLHHWQRVCRQATCRTSGVERRQQSSGRHRSRTRPGHRANRDERQRGGVHSVDKNGRSDQLSANFELLSFDNVETNAVERDEVYATLRITLNDKANTPATLRVKVDTGAQGNVMPLRTFQRMYPSDVDIEGLPMRGCLEHRDTILTAYNGQQIQQYGTTRLKCAHETTTCDTEFFVADTPGPVILGLPTCRKLKLVTLNCAVSEDHPPLKSKEDLLRMYPDCFEGIGKFRETFHITLDPTVTPVVHAPRRCPIHIKDEVKNEINQMVDLGVIEKVDEPTDWVSSIVFSRKSNGKLRICLDPKDLNTAIKRPHYPTPTLEEITHKLAGAVLFSKLDARHGYWSVQLDDESKRLTTFNSPFGRFCFRRLPFGLNLSQDVFQERMDCILEKCPGTISIADDVGVFGLCSAEHDKHLHNLMKVARQHGLVFNIGKCEIKKTNMKFFGLEFDASGVRPDPGRVADIQRMMAPQNVSQLQEFLGIATYMSPFIPNLSQQTATLRDLVKKDAEFIWTESHNAAFEATKAIVCREVTLAYFDPQAETVIQTDASSRGLGAVLIQHGKPIAFASKSLSDCEQRYANIEREMLAVVFGCERFHMYVYGKSFILESDHKPLEMINLKNLAAAPQRLQRMFLRVQPYDFVLRYKPGKQMMLADVMSRQPSSETTQIDLDVQVSFVQFSTQKLQAIKEATRADDELCALRTVIVEGWPESQRHLQPPLRPYWSCRDELSIEDGLIMKGDRLVIPLSLQAEVLTKLHEAHQGIEKTRLRARSCVYWKSISKDIDDMVRKCAACQQLQKCQEHEPLIQHELPTRPWQIIGTDLFMIGQDTYLLICDYYSKFPFVYHIKGKVTSDVIVSKMSEVFAENGSPDRVVSDNGGHYTSQTFRNFATEWDFDHVTSSPHFPQSNGFIERQVQTVKNTLKKAAMTRSNPQKALLALRSTPIDSHLPSPAEMLNARKYKSNLPVIIRNEHWSRDEIRRRLAERQEIQRINHDKRGTQPLTPLVAGQDVRVRDFQTKTWQPAKVITTDVHPRSYNVLTPTGNVLRRNRRHLRETTERHTPSTFQQNDDTRRDDLTPRVETRSDDSARRDDTRRDDVTRGEESRVVLPPDDVVQPPPTGKTVRFEIPQPVVYTRSGRQVKRPDRLGY